LKGSSTTASYRFINLHAKLLKTTVYIYLVANSGTTDIMETVMKYFADVLWSYWEHCNITQELIQRSLLLPLMS